MFWNNFWNKTGVPSFLCAFVTKSKLVLISVWQDSKSRGEMLVLSVESRILRRWWTCVQEASYPSWNSSTSLVLIGQGVAVLQTSWYRNLTVLAAVHVGRAGPCVLTILQKQDKCYSHSTAYLYMNEKCYTFKIRAFEWTVLYFGLWATFSTCSKSNRIQCLH